MMTVWQLTQLRIPKLTQVVFLDKIRG
jgi:hypothetical protein